MIRSSFRSPTALGLALAGALVLLAPAAPAGAARGAARGATHGAAADELGPEAARPAATVLPAAGPVRVPMTVEDGRPVVEVRLNGKGPYRFIVDTGASHTVIDSALAAEVGLPVLGETHMGDPSNPRAIRADRVRIDELLIGEAKFTGVQAAAWNQTRGLGQRASFPRGVIGFPVWHDVLLTLDYVDSTLSLRQGALPASPRTVAFTMPEGIVEMPLRIEGHDYRAHLDTGNGDFLIVPAAETTAVRFAGPLQTVGMARTVNNTFLIQGGRLDGAVELADQRYDRPYIAVQGIMPRVNVGGKLLADYALTFDQRNLRVEFARKRVTPVPTAPANAGPGGRVAGVGVAPQDDGSLLVAMILPGSAAADKDVKVGDRIVRLNGQETKGLSDDQRRSLMRASPVTYTIERDGKRFDVTVEF